MFARTWIFWKKAFSKLFRWHCTKLIIKSIMSYRWDAWALGVNILRFGSHRFKSWVLTIGSLLAVVSLQCRSKIVAHHFSTGLTLMRWSCLGCWLVVLSLSKLSGCILEVVTTYIYFHCIYLCYFYLLLLGPGKWCPKA